jgi:hypothetical protein
LVSSIGILPSREWPPLEPPYKFPSNIRGEEGEKMQNVGEFQDLEGIPYEVPPPLEDYPISEDNSHEWDEEDMQRTREEL